MKIQTCSYCKKEFKTKDRRIKSCSEECRGKVLQRRKDVFAKRHPRKSAEYTRKWAKANRDKTAEYTKKRRSRPEGYVDRFLARARKHTPDSDLDVEFFLGKMDRCAVTGVPFEFKRFDVGKANLRGPSIDRIDPNKGYYKDNVHVVLLSFNYLKSYLPLSDAKELLKEMARGLT